MEKRIFYCLLLSFYIFSLVSCQKPTIYGIVTEFINNNQDTAIYTIIVDQDTGKLTNVTENFVFNGGSGTIDGISALNNYTNTYWYATDSATPFAYSVDVKKKQLLPPLDIGATSILRFAADGKTGLTYSIVTAKTGIYLISIDPTYFVRTIFQFSNQINFGYICATAYNQDSGLLYLIASTKANTSDPQYKVFSINVKTGQIVSTSNALSCVGFTEYFAYDPTSKNLYGIILTVVKNALQYSTVIVNPSTGDCKSFPVTELNNGIVTCATYSPSQQLLYVGEATNHGGYLHKVNPLTGHDMDHVLVSDYLVLESIESSS